MQNLMRLFLCFLFPAYLASTDNEFLQKFEASQQRVFQWIQNEYKSSCSKIPTRFERDAQAVNGDTWYKNYQIKECQMYNKSFCNGFPMKHREVEKPTEISELFDELQDKSLKNMERIETDEKLHSPTLVSHRNDGRINDDTKMEQQLVSSVANDHHDDIVEKDQTNTNYNINTLNIETRLKANRILAQKQNAISDIERQHQQVENSINIESASKNVLSENQLLDQRHIPYSFERDGSRENGNKRSSLMSVRNSKVVKQYSDDQLNHDRNDLFDETASQKLSMREQESNHRVKRAADRRMIINVLRQMVADNKLANKLNDENFNYENINDNPDELENLMDTTKRVNTFETTKTASDMSNVNENFNKSPCNGENETMQVNNQTSEITLSAQNTDDNNEDDVEIKKKRENKQQHNFRRYSSIINGKQRISDLISGELPMEIIKAVHSLVNANENLKHHIKPYLPSEKYEKLKDSTKLSGIKINAMMKDLFVDINELIDDQIQMRSCIPLLPEMKSFYSKLMGRGMDEASPNEDIEPENDEEHYEQSIQRFLMTKKRFTRHLHKSKVFEELDEKYKEIHSLQSMLHTAPLNERIKRSLRKYFSDHIQFLDKIKSCRRGNFFDDDAIKKKRNILVTARRGTEDFIKLQEYKNYIIEKKLELL